MVDLSRTGDEELAPSNSADQDTTDYEALARPMGWRPEAEFKGSKENFVDAKTFYERGKNVLPIVNAANEALRREIDRVREDARSALQLSEQSRQREVAALQAELAAAKEARKEAVASSDGERFEAADARVKELEAAVDTSSAPPPKQSTNGISPELQAWLDRPENNWLRDDEEALAMGDSIARLSRYAALRGQGEKLWNAVAAEVKKKQAAIRAAEREESRADLDRPGPQGAGRGNGEVRTRAGTRSFENLTPEFQKQCDRQYKDFGITISKEKWRERYVSGISEDAFRK